MVPSSKMDNALLAQQHAQDVQVKLNVLNVKKATSWLIINVFQIVHQLLLQTMLEELAILANKIVLNVVPQQLALDAQHLLIYLIINALKIVQLVLS